MSSIRGRAALVALCAAVATCDDDCFKHPNVCGVRPFEVCDDCGGGTGCCKAAPDSPDCFENPGSCGDGKWCQLNDRKSWSESDRTTIGRCVVYQDICESCTQTFAMDNPPEIHGLGADAFYSGSMPGVPLGEYLERTTRCDVTSGLVCTGSLVPSLPPTCVPRRTLPEGHDVPSPAMMRHWGKRWMRMGARNLLGNTTGRAVGVGHQLPQGASRAEVREGANFMLAALWNEELWGPFENLTFEETLGEKCCTWSNYTDSLSDFQRNRTGPEWRNPTDPNHATEGNAPPCVWCTFDGAYNDENPSIWSTIHALTFNLPDTVSEGQHQVLQSLPLFLRQHLSCALCRSHIHEHLIELGIPRTRDGREWAYFYQKAHNYVNEQSEVTRCGSQSCGWGTWNTPPAYRCAGVYRNNWFLTFADASSQWRSAHHKTRWVKRDHY